ncbi:hypothetical protein LXM94_25520 [Rhizobium sp. TRM95111]|uniref:hypothetical protein n=1 Tax=Rhizobium alarense TaxID=2846851 RepID=UPI001F2BD730|nr:hypothetical protein [Rhizobium alarense]MCF3643317.1 hypothetical protein [Rhizobium alarense]
MRSRYIPANSEAREFPAAAVVAYCYDSRRGSAVAAYKGRQSKPALFVALASPEARDAYLAAYIERETANEARKRERQQAAKQPHTLEVGSILNTCWGYEQTNVEFYQVVAVSRSMVTLRQIAASTENTGFMSGRKTPHRDRFTGEPFRCRANATNSVKIDECCRASQWDGRPMAVSWYG